MKSEPESNPLVKLVRSAVLLMPERAVGSFAFLLLVVNTIFCACLLFPMVGVKFLMPTAEGKKRVSAILNELGLGWIGRNNLIMALTKKINWEVTGIEGANPEGWYLVISNHQTWVDILVLQKIFHRKIPFLKFFLKKELIWVPIMGAAWWALDFPFMKRYSKEFLKKHPHLEGKDTEITIKACERFKDIPISVMNFVEGTRFTKAKHARQQSPYKHLLRPKAGGISFVLFAMGRYLNQIANVTIIYPQGPKTFWDFLCSKGCDVRVHVEMLPVTPDIIGDYAKDPAFRDTFQEWLNTLWAAKDALIEDFFNERRKAA
ncbi:MAG TPA: acyltransferase [Deltaproteobacteria bacterium]|nr:acyltransferase [Deltaproteobacteria bacterium]HOI06221.1 acyltransferase [Deltaproteobacteria bacterium]